MLSNGVKVVLKPTTFKEDEVVFSAISRGGTSLASDADLIPAVSAAQVVNTMGYGRFSSAALQRALTGKVAVVRPVIGLYETAITGGSSAKDLETLFELIYLMFTEPRRDPVIFKAFQSSIRSAAANASASPELAFRQTLAATLAQGHPRATVSLENAVDQMDMDRSLAFYKARLADASGFTFVFVGSFNADALTPLAAKYLGALPADRHQETWRDVGIRAPASVVEKTVRKGTETGARTAIVFTGPLANSRAAAVPLTFMANVLQTRLRNALREELGGTYNVTVSTRAQTVPNNEYVVSLEFGADPARVDGLVTRLFGEIAKFRDDGPTPQEVSDVQERLLRDLETQMRQNAWVLSQLVQIYQFNEPTSMLAEAPARVRAVTAANVRDIARTTLDTSRYVRVTLLPESRPGR
jgi:zinc protease